jgi:hypothetical protein
MFAPTFRPTLDEFSDIERYVCSIRDELRRCGIVKVRASDRMRPRPLASLWVSLPGRPNTPVTVGREGCALSLAASHSTVLLLRVSAVRA